MAGQVTIETILIKCTSNGEQKHLKFDLRLPSFNNILLMCIFCSGTSDNRSKWVR